jgi:ATP-dependent Clp protease ATP-binding subunit ClpA
MSNRCFEINCAELEDEYLSDNHFADDARAIINGVLTRSAARALFGEIPSVLLLWSLLRWERKLGIAILEKCGVVRSHLEADVDDVLNKHELPIPVTTVDFQKIAELVISARDVSRSRRAEYVGSEHLLLALITSHEVTLQELLRKHGITYDTAVGALELLNPS